MPTYTYICDTEDGGCGTVFEMELSMKNYKPKQVCPECTNIEPVHRSFVDDEIITSVRLSDNEINVGHLAHRNTERMSNDEKDAITIKNNAYKEKRFRPELPSGMKYIKKENGKLNFREKTKKSKEERLEKTRKIKARAKEAARQLKNSKKGKE